MLPPQNKPAQSIFFALLGGALMALAPLSIDMYLPAFDSIAHDLQGSASMVQLSLAIFFAGITLGQLLYGPLSDRFGRKPPLIFGLLLYVLSSAACLVVPSVSGLIVLRLLQAIGASAGMVISQLLVHDAFKPPQSGKVFSGLMLVMGVAPIVAPLFGGGLMSLSGWRLIFGCLSGFGVFILLAVLLMMPETHAANPAIRLSRVFHVYAHLLKKRDYLCVVLSRAFANAAMFAYITAAPFVFINLLGISAQKFSLVFGANALAMMLGSVLNGASLKKHGMERMLKLAMLGGGLAGLLVLASGFLPLSLPVLFVPLFLFMLSLGVVMPNSSAIGLIGHKEHTGSASSLMGSLQFCVAFLASGAVSAFNNGSVHVMTFGIAICSLLAFLIFRLRPTHPTAVMAAKG